MQFTTLNKIINLFLIGTFTIVMVVVESIFLKIDFNPLLLNFGIDPKGIKDFIQTLGLPAFILLSSIFSVPVVVFLGVTVDAATELTVRTGVKALLRHKFLVCLFANRRDSCKKIYFEKKVDNLLRKTKKYRFLSNVKKVDNPFLDGVDKSFGVAFFFRKGNEEIVDWVIQHYSVYLLATSYLFILSLFVFVTVFLGAIEFTSKIWIFVTYLFLFYLLMYESVRKYLHTWEYTHSYNAVVLCDEATNDDISDR